MKRVTLYRVALSKEEPTEVSFRVEDASVNGSELSIIIDGVTIDIPLRNGSDAFINGWWWTEADLEDI